MARFREEGWLGEEGCAGPAKKQAGPGACLGGQKEAHTWSGRSGAGLDLRQARPACASEAEERCGQRMWARRSSPSRQRRRHPRLLDRKKSSGSVGLGEAEGDGRRGFGGDRLELAGSSMTNGRWPWRLRCEEKHREADMRERERWEKGGKRRGDGVLD